MTRVIKRIEVIKVIDATRLIKAITEKRHFLKLEHKPNYWLERQSHKPIKPNIV